MTAPRRPLPFAIPSESTITDPVLRSILEAVRTNLEIAYGRMGSRNDRFLTVNDALVGRIASFDNQGRLVAGGAKAGTTQGALSKAVATYNGTNMRKSPTTGLWQVFNLTDSYFYNLWASGEQGSVAPVIDQDSRELP
jgi:hypothetical protein